MGEETIEGADGTEVCICVDCKFDSEGCIVGCPGCERCCGCDRCQGNGLHAVAS